jgi:acetoin utilization deacetylase AcuC-like enzyme
MSTGIFYHPSYEKHMLSPGHPERPERVKKIIESLERESLLKDNMAQIVTPSRARLESVYTIHDKEYIKDIKYKSKQGGGWFTLDTSANEYTYEAALLSAGGGIDAVEGVINGLYDNAYVVCRPPGHHAEYSRAMGFCYINNIAVAASYLVNEKGLDRVLILDYDAHHGNGTQNAFYSDERVLYLGIHQDGRTLFPGTGSCEELGTNKGKGYNVNFPMYPGSGDQSYSLVFESMIDDLFDVYHPEFLLVSAGFDCHYSDRLTNLGLTMSGIAGINSRLAKLALKYTGGKIVYFLEGGYELGVLAEGSCNLVRELLDLEQKPREERHLEKEKTIDYTKSLVGIVRNHLENLIF